MPETFETSLKEQEEILSEAKKKTEMERKDREMQLELSKKQAVEGRKLKIKRTTERSHSEAKEIIKEYHEGVTERKRKEVIEALNLKRIYSVIKNPFVEDLAKEIFVERVLELNKVIMYQISDIQQNRWTEYKYMMDVKRKRVSEVRTKHHILAIKEIRSEALSKVYFPVFKVLRADGKFWEFSEADFANLHMDDLEFIYEELRKWSIRQLPVVKALEAVKRFMKWFVYFNYVDDFQMGIESKQPKINLTAPNQELPHIPNVQECVVYEHPEKGITYYNLNSELRFLRFDEIRKYSDGTLRKIRKRVNERMDEVKKEMLNRTKIGRSELQHTMDQTVLQRNWSLYQETLDLINDRIRLRNGLRNFEIIFKTRDCKEILKMWTR